MIASRINETTSLPNLPDNKSFTLSLSLQSNNPAISPIVDLDRIAFIFTSNRVNAPISNYITDKRANTIVEDPSAFYYVSRPVRLENSATAINLLLTGAINEANDIRGFYSIQNDIEEEVIFTPFPGHVNLSRGTSSGEEQAGLVRTIDPSANNGKPDNQSFELSARINSLSNILELTTKPVLFDADNGGQPEHLPYTVRNLERLGVSAIVMEDKIGLKRNNFDNIG